MEIESQSESELPRGVLSDRVEGNYHIVSVRWKDGFESEVFIPVTGFPVINPDTQEQIRKRVDFTEAYEILKHHAADYTHQEFNWHHWLEENRD